MVEKSVEKSDSEKIWEEIENLPISMFSLPGQIVKQHAARVSFPGKDLLIRLVSPAALPALEETLNNKLYTNGKRYEIEVGEGYIMVRRGSNHEEEIKKALGPFIVAK